MFLLNVHYSNGGYMKKIFLVIIIIFLISVTNVSSNSYDYLISDDSYGLYSLYVDGLNTNNFFSFFSDINVIRIYPYINPIYKDRIGNVSYKIDSFNLYYEINTFKNKYLSLIKKNSYSDYNYLYLNGISIDRVDVYMSGTDLYNFLSDSNLVLTVKKITDSSV